MKALLYGIFPPMAYDKSDASKGAMYGGGTVSSQPPYAVTIYQINFFHGQYPILKREMRLSRFKVKLVTCVHQPGHSAKPREGLSFVIFQTNL